MRLKGGIQKPGFPLPSLRDCVAHQPRGRPHLHVFIDGSCLLRVLVMELEGKLCFYHSWRDALGQERACSGSELHPTWAPIRGQVLAKLEKRMEATGPQLHSDGCPMSSSHLLPPKLPLVIISDTCHLQGMFYQVVFLKIS